MRSQQQRAVENAEPRPAYDTPYTVSEVARMTRLSVQTIIRLFQHERGVIVLERKAPGKRRYRSLRIPRRVYERVIAEWTAQS